MMNYETVTVETDFLILGGGMAACGAAIEASYWAKKHGIKITLVDKAAMDRSGAVGMGLARDDLVANIARHVDSTVHLFEKWGLPLWKDEKGEYVHEGRWQLMIS